jgi:hypothetical protein
MSSEQEYYDELQDIIYKTESRLDAIRLSNFSKMINAYTNDDTKTFQEIFESNANTIGKIALEINDLNLDNNQKISNIKRILTNYLGEGYVY